MHFGKEKLDKIIACKIEQYFNCPKLELKDKNVSGEKNHFNNMRRK